MNAFCMFIQPFFNSPIDGGVDGIDEDEGFIDVLNGALKAVAQSHKKTGVLQLYIGPA